MIDFLLGMGVMGVLVMLLCIFVMRQEKKQVKLTPPETLQFFIPNVGLKMKAGDTVVTNRAVYVIEGLYDDSIFLRRKDA
jgi:hypothetical protein